MTFAMRLAMADVPRDVSTLLAELARVCGDCLTPVAGAEDSGYVVYRINREQLATPRSDWQDEPNRASGK